MSPTDQDPIPYRMPADEVAAATTIQSFVLPSSGSVLAQQPIDSSKPHPFIEAGHREFNMFLWMPPKDDRAGDFLLADSTIFTTLFGGD